MQRDDFAQQVREAIDIVDVVSDQTSLKRRGKRLLGLCPFHKEKTPSFSVDPDQGLYYCFGCGAGGDALGFHMQVTGDDFRTTLETMARRYGVPIPARGAVDRGPDLEGVLSAALDFFRDHLRRSQFATRYLDRRRIDPQLSDKFGVGFAPDGWQNLCDQLGKQFPQEELLGAGLIGRSEKSGRLYDRFRNRLMFPIRSTTGRLVGFGGRTLGDDRAKYVNTAETEAFTKGKILYGLDVARPKIREAGKVLLVEGYFDVLGAVASGIEWSVASMGTALTNEQATMLVRYADDIVLGYDGDRAGEEAARKSVNVLLGLGASVRRARFPAGQDPDSLRLEEGPDVVQRVVEEAPDAVLLEIDRIPASASQDPRRAADAAKPIAELLSQVPDELMRRQYAKRAAGRLGVDDDLLLRAPEPRPLGRAEAEDQDKPDTAKKVVETDSIEHQVLRLLLAGARPDLPLPVEAFWDAACRLLYTAWQAAVLDEEHGGDLKAAVLHLAPGKEAAALELLARLTLVGAGSTEQQLTAAEDGAGEADEQTSDELTDDDLAQLDELLELIERRYVRHENRRLRDALAEAQRDGDAAAVERLVEKKIALSQRVFGSA